VQKGADGNVRTSVRKYMASCWTRTDKTSSRTDEASLARRYSQRGAMENHRVLDGDKQRSELEAPGRARRCGRGWLDVDNVRDAGIMRRQSLVWCWCKKIPEMELQRRGRRDTDEPEFVPAVRSK
jgi:hypothetical protein